MLKAYVVTERCESTGGVVFAEHHAVARREGAAIYADGDWDSVDCRREKGFDQFAPGPVPISAYLAVGWYWPCHNCDKSLTEDDEPLIIGQSIFCDRWCRLDLCEARGRGKAENRLAANMCRISLPFVIPGDISGHRESKHVDGKYRDVLAATFQLPNVQYDVRWNALDPRVCWVSQIDVEAFDKWKSENPK